MLSKDRVSSASNSVCRHLANKLLFNVTSSKTSSPDVDLVTFCQLIVWGTGADCEQTFVILVTQF